MGAFDAVNQGVAHILVGVDQLQVFQSFHLVIRGRGDGVDGALDGAVGPDGAAPRFNNYRHAALVAPAHFRAGEALSRADDNIGGSLSNGSSIGVDDAVLVPLVQGLVGFHHLRLFHDADNSSGIVVVTDADMGARGRSVIVHELAVDAVADHVEGVFAGGDIAGVDLVLDLADIGIHFFYSVQILIGDAVIFNNVVVPYPVLSLGVVLVGGDAVDCVFVGNAFPAKLRNELFQVGSFSQQVVQGCKPAQVDGGGVDVAVVEHDVKIFAALEHCFDAFAPNAPVQVSVIAGNTDLLSRVFVQRVGNHIQVVGLAADLNPGKVYNFAGRSAFAGGSFTGGAAASGRIAGIAAAGSKAGHGGSHCSKQGDNFQTFFH